MTIAKKMLITGLFAVSAQFGVFAYDAVGLKTEVNQVKDFSEKIMKFSTAQATTVSAWLNDRIKDDCGVWNDNGTILDIVRIINSSTSDDYKIMNILVMIEAEKVAQEQKKIAAAKSAKRHEKNVAKWNTDEALRIRQAKINDYKKCAGILIASPIVFAGLITVEFFVRNALADWKNAKVVVEAVAKAAVQS